MSTQRDGYNFPATPVMVRCYGNQPVKAMAVGVWRTGKRPVKTTIEIFRADPAVTMNYMAEDVYQFDAALLEAILTAPADELLDRWDKATRFVPPMEVRR